MKHLLSTFIIFSLSIPSFGQLKMGLKLGYSKTSSNQTSNEYLNLKASSLYNLDYVASEDCMSFGLSLYADHGNLFFNTDFMFRNHVHQFLMKTRQYSKTSNGAYRESYSVIHIPVAGGIYYKSIKLGAGPIFNYHIGSENEIVEMDGFTTEQRDFSMGFQFSIGMRLNKHFHLDLKREISFNRVASNYYFLDRPMKIESNPHLTSLTLAMYL